MQFFKLFVLFCGHSFVILSLSKDQFESLLGGMKPGRILFSQARIQARTRELGKAITRHYRGRQPVFLGIMNGALFFFTDLMRAVDLDELEVSCIRLASYVGTKSSGKIVGLDSLSDSFKGRDVLVIDDILETGRTLSALTMHLKKLGATEVKTCVLLHKRGKQEAFRRADWTGFTIDDHFVIGYGLDYDGRYRGLKSIHVMA